MKDLVRLTAVAIILTVGFALVWLLAVRSGKISVADWEKIKQRISKNAKDKTLPEIIADINSVLS